jgi:hypothetical protein
METDPGTHCKGGWVGPRAHLNITEKEKNLAPARKELTEEAAKQIMQ